MAEYLIAKTFPPIRAVRFLDSPEKPYCWVSDPRDAYRFSNPSDLAEELDAEIVEAP